MKHVPPPTGEPIAPPQLTPEALAARLATEATKREKALQRLRKLRTKAADEIDRLLEFLDAVDDTDVDCAVDDDPCDDLEAEPSLCGVTAAAPNMPDDFDGQDMEGDDTATGSADDEPSLGSGAAGPYESQNLWSQPGGASDDREPDAGDDREEENEHCDGHADSEPSLGWPEGMAQGQRRWGGTDDRELSGEPSKAFVDTARKRHNRNSICNVHPIAGAEWKVD